MKIVTDVHTHTLVSGHAYSTMKEMILAGKEAGMELVALTEHAPTMPGTCGSYYFQNFSVIPRQQFGIEVMLGAELNLLDCNGNLDLEQRVIDGLDLGIASIHPPCYGENHSKKENTKAFLRVMENSGVQIIGHPDDDRYPVDYEELVKGAVATGTLLELNNASLNPKGFRLNSKEHDQEMLRYCEKYEAMIVVNSDAHYETYIGRFPYAKALLEEIHFPEELVASTSSKKLKKLIQAKKNGFTL